MWQKLNVPKSELDSLDDDNVSRVLLISASKSNQIQSVVFTI